MADFHSALNKIQSGIEDALSLDVVTFKGTVNTKITDSDMSPKNFAELLKMSNQTDAKVKLMASTQISVDGDVLVYFDDNVTLDEVKAHAELVAIGQKAREATIDFVLSVTGLKKS